MSLLKPLAIIVGAGLGTGGSIATRFGEAYTVALLARSSTTAETSYLPSAVTASPSKPMSQTPSASAPRSAR